VWPLINHDGSNNRHVGSDSRNRGTKILRVTIAVNILVLIITGLLGCVAQIVHTAQCSKQSFVSAGVAQMCLSIYHV
jgi:hypothetical protein